MLRATLLLSLLSTPALAFQARNDAQVDGRADQIIVASRPGLASSESWCAAGDFVIRGLGMASTTPVYRLTPPPRRAGESVEFSLSPAGATERLGLVRFGGTADQISAGHAQALCRIGRWK